jgi:tetratricopeptide (TPR) repeat protein
LTATACGTSTVNLTVVRPAAINARAYGGTVTVPAVLPMRPDLNLAAGQLRHEIAVRIQNGLGGTVRLMEVGGGVHVYARLDDYSENLQSRSRADSCKDTVKEVKDGKTTFKEASVPCTWRWHEWTARVSVMTQISTATGEMLALRPVTRQATGRTTEVREGQVPLPNLHAVLQGLRQEVADEIAWLVVPHSERLNVKFYDCDEPAKAVCEVALRQLADGQHDASVASFTQALQALENARAPATERAEVLWNRGLVFKYAHRYDEARADLIRAHELDPSMEYAAQIEEIERARGNHHQLLEQGLQPVQAPGGK